MVSGVTAEDEASVLDEAVSAILDGGTRVRGAGGLVYRRNARGEAEVLLVHRPNYDDWSPPKGKCKDPERLEMTALREVEEETGLTCFLERSLGTIEYLDHRGREKMVWFWLMRPIQGGFVATPEVDRVRWVPFSDALNGKPGGEPATIWED